MARPLATLTASLLPLLLVPAVRILRTPRPEDRFHVLQAR